MYIIRHERIEKGRNKGRFGLHVAFDVNAYEYNPEYAGQAAG